MPRKITKLPALAMPYGRKLNPQAGKQRILGRLAYALSVGASLDAMIAAMPAPKPDPNNKMADYWRGVHAAKYG